MPAKQGTLGLSAIYNGIDKIGKIYKGVELYYQSVLPKTALANYVDGSLTVLTPEDFDGATQLKTHAFYRRENLTSITMSDTITTINGQRCFSSCEALSSVTLSNNLQHVGSYMFEECDALTSIVIPSSVKAIYSSAFVRCRNLKSITLNTGLKSIGANAFENTALTEINFPNTLETIGANAFRNTKLISITLPSSITSIGDYAFDTSYGTLSEIRVEALTPPTIGERTFEFATGLNIYVPEASLEAYRSATNWSKFASYIWGGIVYG